MKYFLPILILSLLTIPTFAQEKQTSIIKVGMEFEEAEKILKDFGAKEVDLQVMPAKSSTGEFMELVSYVLRDNPHIIINYEQENGKDIIRELSLYYLYEHKADPNNKYLNVTEIDLDNFLNEEEQFSR